MTASLAGLSLAIQKDVGCLIIVHLHKAILSIHKRSPSVLHSAGAGKTRWGSPHLLLGTGKPDVLLYLFAKNEQGDLTPTQLKVLARLVREEFT